MQTWHSNTVEICKRLICTRTIYLWFLQLLKSATESGFTGSINIVNNVHLLTWCNPNFEWCSTAYTITTRKNKFVKQKKHICDRGTKKKKTFATKEICFVLYQSIVCSTLAVDCNHKNVDEHQNVFVIMVLVKLKWAF